MTQVCAAILNVPDDHETIQKAIDDAEDGDTVLVAPGTYYENFDLRGRKLTVGSLFLTTGEERYIQETVIDPTNDGLFHPQHVVGETDSKLVGFIYQSGGIKKEFLFFRKGISLYNITIVANKPQEIDPTPQER